MANNIFQVKRTSTAGRTPNTTSSSNTQYINAGELALNMTDKILYTSDGTNLITVGANTSNSNITNTLTANVINASGIATFSNTTASVNTTSGAITTAGGIGVANNLYVGGRVGWANSTSSVVYQYYNPATNSLDTVFG